MLESVNLSLSTACGANCIFCPSNRGQRIKEKIMPFSTVKKIIDELSSEEFKKHHNIQKMELGENGDAFLNKDLIKILRLIKSKLPEINVVLHTNFQNFTEEKAEIILKEDLVRSVTCNLDGSNEQNYFNVKRMDFNKVKIHLIKFLELRKRLNKKVPLRILVLTLNNYITTIYNNLGIYPAKLKDINLKKIPDDFALIKKQLNRILDPKLDKSVRSWVFAWAERNSIDTNKIKYKRYTCTNLIRLPRDAFIAPDGTWYACCFDSNNELVLGNVLKQSLNEIYNNEPRKRLMWLLKKKQFAKIGGPCKTVNCCQMMHRNPLLSQISRIIFKSKLLTELATKNSTDINIKTGITKNIKKN